MERFTRTELLIGRAGLEKLEQAHVSIFGLGGVGSATAEALARAGVGELTLVDFDKVAVSNLNRQLVATEDTIGQLKVEAMATRLKLINPALRLHFVSERFTIDTPQYLEGDYDYIADCIDSVPDKVALIAGAVERQIPIVSAMGAGNKMDPTKFKVADLAASFGCPLAKIMRQRLKALGVTCGVPVVFSPEPPLLRGQVGTISFVPPVAGMIVASVVVRSLLGAE